MTEFILRIFFSGLIAFVPSEDGRELSVLLVNTPHEYSLADGTALAHHRPLLLARGASCEGTCTTTTHQSIAQYMFSNKTPQQALTSLNQALLGGGAWELSNAELSLNGPQEPLNIRTGLRTSNNGTLSAVPATPTEREDFTWIASMNAVVPGSGGFKNAVSSPEAPPGCVVAARLKLRSGKVFTYSVIRVDGKARPVRFRNPSGDGTEAPYAQALANWAAAEIRVPGDFVEITDVQFNDPERRRTMKLRPEQGVVEMALLNLPPFEAPAPDAPAGTPAPGQHFQIYYDLVKAPPARAARLVPYPSAAAPAEPQVEWAALHPRTELWSNLLEGLGMSPRGKGPYELAFCPIIRP